MLRFISIVTTLNTTLNTTTAYNDSNADVITPTLQAVARAHRIGQTKPVQVHTHTHTRFPPSLLPAHTLTRSYAHTLTGVPAHHGVIPGGEDRANGTLRYVMLRTLLLCCVRCFEKHHTAMSASSLNTMIVLTSICIC
jgi:hypothetical protein